MDAQNIFSDSLTLSISKVQSGRRDTWEPEDPIELAVSLGYDREGWTATRKGTTHYMLRVYSSGVYGIGMCLIKLLH